MSAPRTPPLASVSLDLDNQWSYMKTHGDAGWESRPSYLDTLIPLALDALDRLELRITFFVVGLDADRAENRDSLGLITARGHEVGNHSYEHEPWLHRYTPEAVDAEIARAEEAIAGATGVRPTGFRGPGFDWSPDVLRVLGRRGYLYDASTFPTFLGPLARAYYFWTARLSPEERAERSKLFGGAREGFRPIAPYQWDLGGSRLLEIPVTTVPLIRTPFHLSYLLYLARFSRGLMRAYLGTALRACRWSGVAPSFLLHPLDLLGGDRCPELRFFPGMDLSTGHKLELFDGVLRTLGRHFRLAPMGVHAHSLLQRPDLRRRALASAA